MANRVIHFEGIGLCFCHNREFREPRRGEYYLSGAIVAAHRAPNDLTTKYQIVVPTYEAVRVEGYKRGRRIVQREGATTVWHHWSGEPPWDDAVTPIVPDNLDK
jgi:hypothetical protein